MARPIRIEYPNAYYHVTSRGNTRQTLFRDGEDHASFLRMLGEGSRKYRVKVYAFVLMGNHYHLLLQTEQENLSQFMRHVNGGYTQRFNRRHRRTGHVTQGRYKAILVEDESYFDELIRYIHLNPYRAGMVKDIDEYPYSSHQAVLDSTESRKWQEWYDVERILKHFGSRPKEAIRHYRQFIEDGKQRKIRNVLEESHFGYILGSEALVRWVQERFLDKKQDREYRAITEMRRTRVKVEDIVAAVCRELKVSRESLLKATRGRAKPNTARLMALYLIHKWCCLTQKEAGALFGGVSNVTISASVRRFGELLSTDKAIAGVFSKVSNSLNVKTWSYPAFVDTRLDNFDSYCAGLRYPSVECSLFRL